MEDEESQLDPYLGGYRAPDAKFVIVNFKQNQKLYKPPHRGFKE